MYTQTWQQVQQENNITTDSFSRRVKDRILDFNKKEKELGEYETANADLSAQLETLDAGTKAYKSTEKDINALTDAIAETKEKLVSLNEKLCADMVRLKKNGELYKQQGERLKGLKKTDAGVTNNQPAAESSTASVPLMITQEMRQQLYALQYTEQDVDKLKPEEANEIIAAQTVKVAATNDTTEKPTQTAADDSIIQPDQPAGNEPPAGPKVVPGITKIETPAKINPSPKAAAAATEATKKNKNMAVGIFLGIAAFVGGIFLGKGIKN